MARHIISSVQDALRFLNRYEIANWPHGLPGSLLGFASRLYLQTKVLTTTELSRYIVEYTDDLNEGAETGIDLNARWIEDADDAMQGRLAYERTAGELLWLVRQAKSTDAGRAAWTLLSLLGSGGNRAALLDATPSQGLLVAVDIVRKLADLAPALTPGADAYTARSSPLADAIMQEDIWFIDETLECRERWEDDEHMTYPAEVVVVGALSLDMSLIAALDAELARRTVAASSSDSTVH